jgi:hypothetical protein
MMSEKKSPLKYGLPLEKRLKKKIEIRNYTELWMNYGINMISGREISSLQVQIMEK